MGNSIQMGIFIHINRGYVVCFHKNNNNCILAQSTYTAMLLQLKTELLGNYWTNFNNNITSVQ